ncbi:MAG: aldo/keto reductase [Gammaproteobacteria bacterium]|nr:aldo/keto reductase [Gammaproteobacteria bacterium]
MQYTQLGRSGLSVSRLVLGTMNFGQFTPEPDAHAILDRALGHGINFVDTANMYGGTAGPGITEEIIGRWFARGEGRRERTVLATKLYNSMKGFGRTDNWPNTTRLSALHIRQACDDSLRRLGTDYIDLYQMHHIDRTTPFDEIWEAFAVLRQQGKVIYFGSSNFAGWHLVQAQEAALRRHQPGLVSEQSLYNLRRRTVELEVLPAARAYGIGVIPWSPLSGGLLGGVLRKAREGRSAGPMTTRWLEEDRARIERWEALCDQLGEAPADVALAWLLHQPGVTAPIIGPRTVGQLDQSLRALEIRLEAGFLAELDQVFPGPGGPAPEAYAW